MKRAITYGTFDLIHRGHINILKKAREMADYLIVGVSSDEFDKIKNKTSYYTFEERKYILESIKYVDLVIPENDWKQKRSDIIKYNVDFFVMGEDWKGRFDDLQDICEVIYLPRTENISTTKIKDDLKNI